jgi:hypothetical protein
MPNGGQIGQLAGGGIGSIGGPLGIAIGSRVGGMVGGLFGRSAHNNTNRGNYWDSMPDYAKSNISRDEFINWTMSDNEARDVAREAGADYTMRGSGTPGQGTASETLRWATDRSLYGSEPEPLSTLRMRLQMAFYNWKFGSTSSGGSGDGTGPAGRGQGGMMPTTTIEQSGGRDLQQPIQAGFPKWLIFVLIGVALFMVFFKSK